MRSGARYIFGHIFGLVLSSTYRIWI